MQINEKFTEIGGQLKDTTEYESLDSSTVKFQAQGHGEPQSMHLATQCSNMNSNITTIVRLTEPPLELKP